jgi:cyclohexadienyl dehydratase
MRQTSPSLLRNLKCPLGALWVTAALLSACAGLREPGELLRVGTSGDYAPFSTEAPDGGLDGFDVAAAQAYAESRGLELRFVRFRWPELAAALAAGRFDVAMSGVTVRADRSVAAPFTRPVALSSAVAVVAEAEHFATLEALDAAEVTIAVNAGGHLERVTRARFPRARILTVTDNEVPARLIAGEADALVTDTLEAPGWLASHPDWKQLAPFTFDRKAWWVRPGRPDLLRDLDRFAAERAADGTLAGWRATYFGEAAAGPPVATALPALFWSLRERLELMPLVAEAKRASGVDVEAPEREQRVLDAAWQATLRAARDVGRPPPPEAAVRALFQAQIEAAKAIQRATLAGPPSGEPAPSLTDELRPALIALGERIAGLLLELDATPRAEVDALATRCLSMPGLPVERVRALADAVAALGAQAPR